jgi:hypothetical protein
VICGFKRNRTAAQSGRGPRSCVVKLLFEVVVLWERKLISKASFPAIKLKSNKSIKYKRHCCINYLCPHRSSSNATIFLASCAVPIDI